MSNKKKSTQKGQKEVPEEVVVDTTSDTQEPPQELVTEVNIDYKDKWIRAHADYQNLQKEISDQRGQWVKMSKMQILEEFIPVYENFKKAFAHEVEGEHTSWENWKKGIEYIKKQFGDILTQHGVEEIQTVGVLFNPAEHEALSEEVSDEHEEGAIIRELSGGYKVGNKVLIAAKVVVCKK